MTARSSNGVVSKLRAAVPRRRRRRDARKHLLLVVENAAVPHDRRVWNQARAGARNGYEVTVICPKGRAPADVSSEDAEGVHIRRFPMPFGGPRKVDFLLEYGWAMVCIFALSVTTYLRRPFHLIHVANPPDLFFGLQWMFGRLGVAFVFDQHDLGPETYQSKFDEPTEDAMYKALWWIEQRSYAAADTVIVTNHSYEQRALGRGGMAQDDVFVVRNSPDLDLFRPRAPKPELRRGFDHLAVFVGTMGHQDGVHIALEAAAHVRRTLGRTDIGFVFIGTGDTWERLQARLAELDLGDGVWFTGFISDDDMLDHLSSSTVGLAPDLDSPLNNISTMIKTMDYMAMELPVVSFDLIESRFSAGEAAIYAADHSPEAFGDAVVELVDDAERREKMQRLGVERIHGPLSWSVSEANLMACYQRAFDRVSGR